jgi:hypothetical protein
MSVGLALVIKCTKRFLRDNPERFHTMATESPSSSSPQQTQTDYQRASVSPPREIDNLAQFESEVRERFQIQGHNTSTVIGWMLFIVVMADLLMNASGAGLFSAAVAASTVTVESLRSQPTWLFVTICICQGLLLILSGTFLSQSPWRLWMRKTLRESWFLEWLFKKHTIDATDLSHAGTPPWPVRYAVLRDLALYAACLLGLVPALAALTEATRLNLAVAGMIILGLAFFVAKTVAALINARKDRHSAAGLLFGLLAAALVGPFSKWESIPGTAMTHQFVGFEYAQLWMFGFAILGICALGLGSVGESDTIPLVLSNRSSWVEHTLFEAARTGVYLPFRFRVKAVDGLKVALLKQPPDGGEFEICSLESAHELTTDVWHLLNLSELKRRYGSGIVVTKYSSEGYFKMVATFSIETRSGESTFDPADVKTVRSRDYWALTQLLAHGDRDELSQWVLRQIEIAAGEELEKSLTPDPLSSVPKIPDHWEPYSIKTISSLEARFKSDGEKVRQAVNTARFEIERACSSGIALDKSSAFDDALQRVKNTLQEEQSSLDDAYRFASSLDSKLPDIQKSLDATLSAIPHMLESLLTANSLAPKSETLGLFRLITLAKKGDVDLVSTPELRSAQQEIKTLYDSVIASCSAVVDAVTAAMAVDRERAVDILKGILSTGQGMRAAGPSVLSQSTRTSLTTSRDGAKDTAMAAVEPPSERQGRRRSIIGNTSTTNLPETPESS